MGIASSSRMTADDFLSMAGADHMELVDGEPRELGTSYKSSIVAGRLITRISNATEGRGEAGTADCALRIFTMSADPDRIRRPDVLYFSNENRPPDEQQTGYCETVPDFVAEIVTDGDDAAELERKVREYMLAGIPLAWVVHPSIKRIYAHTRSGVTVFDEDDIATAEPAVPGFSVRVGDLFPADR